MIARALLLAAGTLLAGCAAMAPPVTQPESKDLKPLPSYAVDPFVPINLYLNANEQSPKALAALVQYTADQLRSSGAFVRVDQGVQRWPITLQARYQVQEYAGAGDGARRFARWLTLGLLPVRTSQVHTLSVEVVAEPLSAAKLEFSVTVTQDNSVYGDGTQRSQRAAADALLQRLLDEISQRRLIPRWAAFKPNPAKPVTNPVQPARQPA